MAAACIRSVPESDYPEIRLVVADNGAFLKGVLDFTLGVRGEGNPPKDTAG